MACAARAGAARRLLDVLGMRNTTWLVAIAIVLVPVLAGAQPRPTAIPSSNGDGLDTHLFRPALDSRGLISLNGVDVLPAGRISVGLTMDYGRGLLRVADVGQKSTALVRDSFTGTFAFDYGIADRAVVGISAPALLMSGDPQPGTAGWGPLALDAQSNGHVALHGKLKLTRARRQELASPHRRRAAHHERLRGRGPSCGAELRVRAARLRQRQRRRPRR